MAPTANIKQRFRNKRQQLSAGLLFAAVACLFAGQLLEGLHQHAAEEVYSECPACAGTPIAAADNANHLPLIAPKLNQYLLVRGADPVSSYSNTLYARGPPVLS